MSRRVLCACLVLALASSRPASAAIVGYSLLVSGNAANYPASSTLELPASPNTPLLRLTNTSTSTQISSFSITVGNTTYNFDSGRSESFSAGAAISSTLVGPDSNNFGGLRADSVGYSFTGFDASEFFQFQADLDIDGSDSTEDFTTVFFNNGANANSVITVSFSDGTVLSQTIPENPSASDANEYTFAQSQVVPEPTTLTMFGLGAIAFAGAAIRRRFRKSGCQSQGILPIKALPSLEA